MLGATGNVNLANAACGAVTTGLGMLFDNIYGGTQYSFAEICVNTIADAGLSYGLGQVLQLNGLTSGSNNWGAVYKSGLTKLRNGTAMRMSGYVMSRGFTSNFISGLLMDMYYGVKQKCYKLNERIW